MLSLILEILLSNSLFERIFCLERLKLCNEFINDCIKIICVILYEEA